MEVTVLGCHAPWPPSGGACNGYLLQSGATTVLVDCGPSVASRIIELGVIDRLDAVVVSHLHEDHISDLHCLQFAVLSGRNAGRRSGPLPIYRPSEPVRQRAWLEPVVEGLYDLHDLPVGEGLQVGNLHFTFAPTAHPIPCWAMRVTDGAGTWFFSSDTSRDAADRLVPLAAGADLAFIEASLSESMGDMRWLGHLTAVDAAHLGRQAGVKRLLLTHFRPDVDVDLLLAEARAVWPETGRVVEWQTYRVGK